MMVIVKKEQNSRKSYLYFNKNDRKKFMNKKPESYIMPTYGERDLVFSKGKECYLYTPSGKKYLDFAGGIAVNSLGHCHPKLVSALKNSVI